MRILLLHNEHEYTGGEERALAADIALLTARGHEPHLYRRTYAEASRAHGPLVAGLGADLIWSRRSYAEIRRLVRRLRPEVAHFHNIFPLISPSAYAACRAESVPIVQTLHNYRPICAAGTLLRQSLPCQKCVGRPPWPAVRYACYRGSHPQSAVLASSFVFHRLAGTWRSVDAYIALSDFAREVFVRGGLAADRIFVRSNAVDDQPPRRYVAPQSAIYVGRLSPEKGVDTLLRAATEYPDVPLTIVGDGPLLSKVRAVAGVGRLAHVTVTGPLPHDQALQLMRAAGILVVPSLAESAVPLVVLEAFAAGVPVIASRLGPLRDLVDGSDALLFPPGDSAALAAAVRRIASSVELAQALSAAGRKTFVQRYSPTRSYDLLIAVYRHAVGGDYDGLTRPRRIAP